MQLAIWLSFVGTSLIFCLLPGPSICFTIAHALKNGTRKTWPTILGQLAANCVQILIVLFGLSGILNQSLLFFQGLKICGAAYLIFLGCRQWTAGRPDLVSQRQTDAATGRRAFRDGFIVCGTNPKAIFFYAALLPQFVLPGGDEGIQLIILAVTNLLIGALVLGFYSLLAGGARSWFTNARYWKAQNRFTACLMIGAGIALSAVSRK